ncbi:unnamed protein product [Orchesella dallaii]|uniref:Fatty acid desaturase 2 n=1 Tax=Orchesella dallaii TaxID=48710 RepID=A0ABP1QUX2_9HEXA
MAPYQDTTFKGTQPEDRVNKVKEILYDGVYYNVTDFIGIHPGGRQIMEYFCTAGEDATLPIQQFHSRTIGKVNGLLKSFKKRPASDLEDVKTQKVQEKNKQLTDDFTKLYLELKAEGLFKPSYFHTVYRILEMVMLAAVGLFLITQTSNFLVKSLGCIFLSLGQIRALGVMHETGHLSLTGNPKWDRLIQAFAHGSFMGHSAIFWRRYHSLHHAQTSRLKHDLDFEHLPVVLLNINVIDDPKKDQNIVLRHPLLLAPVALLFQTWKLQFWETGTHLVKHRIPSEILAIGIYYFFAWHVGILPWIVCTAMTMSHFGFTTSLNHSYLPITTKPTHWVEQALVHTVNIEQSWWCDWWMFYLNFQIEHHLFPTMPQFRNRRAVERVKALAQKHGLPYRVYSYKDACVKSMKNLLDISDELKRIHNHGD